MCLFLNPFNVCNYLVLFSVFRNKYRGKVDRLLKSELYGDNELEFLNLSEIEQLNSESFVMTLMETDYHLIESPTSKFV